METSSAIFVRAWRYDPERPAESRYNNYEIFTTEPLSVMALLAKIHEMDASFACRTSTCFKGQCGSCLVRVNGRDALGCVTLVRPGETVTLEPHSGYRVVRDVVVDFSQPREG